MIDLEDKRADDCEPVTRGDLLAIARLLRRDALRYGDREMAQALRVAAYAIEQGLEVVAGEAERTGGLA